MAKGVYPNRRDKVQLRCENHTERHPVTIKESGGGGGHTYSGVDPIVVNNTRDQISIKPLIAGTNIQIGADGRTISATDTKYGIASETNLGLIKVGENLTIDEDGTLNAQAGGKTYQAGQNIIITDPTSETPTISADFTDLVGGLVQVQLDWDEGTNYDNKQWGSKVFDSDTRWFKSYNFGSGDEIRYKKIAVQVEYGLYHNADFYAMDSEIIEFNLPRTFEIPQVGYVKNFVLHPLRVNGTTGNEAQYPIQIPDTVEGHIYFKPKGLNNLFNGFNVTVVLKTNGLRGSLAHATLFTYK